MSLSGFSGDPEREARLHEALLGVARVFPEHVAKPKPPTWFDPEEIAKNDQFDAIVRAHKKDRLAMPIQALLRAGAPYHNFDLMHARRLAWFVPSLLSGWLDRATGDVRAPDIEAIVAGTTIVEGDDWTFTEEESTALADFFEAAVLAAIATPLPPARPPERPPEDGMHVWSFHAPSVPLDVLRVAKAMRIDVEPLAFAWASDDTALALDHLVEAVFDPTAPAKRWLAHDVVADRLAEAFFAATGERAIRLSKAEKHIRRWIERAAEWP